MSEDLRLLLGALAFLYPFVDAFIKWIGGLVLGQGQLFARYIKLSNILYFPVFPLVLYFFTLGEWSVFSGLQEVMSDDFSGDGAAVLIIAVAPIACLLASIFNAFTCGMQILKGPMNFYFNEDE